MFGNTPHTIRVTLKTDGKVESVVEGVKGPSCEDLLRWMEQLGTVTHEEKTAEYFQSDEQGVGLGIEV